MNDIKSEVDVGEGRYLYCVINNPSNDFWEMGIDNKNVYAVHYGDVCALVHDCPTKPYETKDEIKAKSWLVSHLHIIDKAAKRFGTVIPFAFDTILKGTDDDVRKWLIKEYSRLKSNFEKLKSKAEYDIQFFLDIDIVSQKIESDNKEIQDLKKDIETKSKGIAHVLNKKLELMIKNELRKRIDECCKEIYNQVKEYVAEIKVEIPIKLDIEKIKDKEMVLNLSCLVDNNVVDTLGNALEQLDKTDGLSVRFSGPWPPFNFVS